MKNRTGFELPVGVLATYFIFKLWWAGWFQAMGIQLLAPELPHLLMSSDSQLLTADQVYGSSVFGTLFIEGINLMVGVGTLVIWVITGIWAALKDVVYGTADGMKVVRGLEWPSLDFWNRKPSTPAAVEPAKQPGTAGAEARQEAARVIVANELVSAAIDGSRERVIAAAEMLHGKQFIDRAIEPPLAVEPKAVKATTRRKTTATKK